MADHSFRAHKRCLWFSVYSDGVEIVGGACIPGPPDAFPIGIPERFSDGNSLEFSSETHHEASSERFMENASQIAGRCGIKIDHLYHRLPPVEQVIRSHLFGGENVSWVDTEPCVTERLRDRPPQPSDVFPDSRSRYSPHPLLPIEGLW